MQGHGFTSHDWIESGGGLPGAIRQIKQSVGNPRALRALFYFCNTSITLLSFTLNIVLIDETLGYYLGKVHLRKVHFCLLILLQ